MDKYELIISRRFCGQVWSGYLDPQQNFSHYIMSEETKRNEEKRPLDSDNESEDSDSDAEACRLNCDQLRARIVEYCKTVTTEEFVQKISVDIMDLKRFMSYKGFKVGQTNPVYVQANKLFDSIDKKDMKVKHEQKKVKVVDNDYIKRILAVDLPYNIKVYDDCDLIRKKINDFIDSKIITKTDFTRVLDINSNSLRTFLMVNGVKKGAGIPT